MNSFIIAGGRSFTDYQYLKESCTSAISDYCSKNREKSVEIFCGMASGADTLGERFAKENGYKIRYFPANWERYGKRAGILRNEEMVLSANALIAFWNGKSKGTEHVLKFAYKNNLWTQVYRYSDD